MKTHSLYRFFLIAWLFLSSVIAMGRIQEVEDRGAPLSQGVEENGQREDSLFLSFSLELSHSNQNINQLNDNISLGENFNDMGQGSSGPIEEEEEHKNAPFDHLSKTKNKEIILTSTHWREAKHLFSEVYLAPSLKPPRS